MDTIIFSWLGTFGSPVAALVILLGAVGLPLPTSLVVAAAGVFVRLEIMNPLAAFGLALLGTLLGDGLTYWFGRRGFGWMEQRMGGSKAWGQARRLFNHHGGAAVFLTRWLFTGIASPVGVMAGGSRYPYAKFLAWDIAGEALWLLAYGSLGWTFSGQLQDLSDTLAQFGGQAMLAAAVVGALLLGLRLLSGLLRGKRVSVNLL